MAAGLVKSHSAKDSSFPVVLPASRSVASTPTKVDAGHGPFMAAMIEAENAPQQRAGRTCNGDATLLESGSHLLDLFQELEDQITPQRLESLLAKAWKQDATSTLRILWNTRSIHLGKGDKEACYRALGWVATHHPDTFLANLPWLARPVIKKAVAKPGAKAGTSDNVLEDGELVERMDLDSDSDFDIVNTTDAAPPAVKKQKIKDHRSVTEFDSKHGHAHGSWKDLLNLLVLAANSQLNVDGNIHETLSKPREKKRKNVDWTAGRKTARLKQQHERVSHLLEHDDFYQRLHTLVAKLFAEQLQIDLARLKTARKSELAVISMAAKWAPSGRGSHDAQTFVVSTIADLMFPEFAKDDGDRAEQVWQARIAYQSRVLAPLRKHLDIVERHIADGTFSEIDYSHVPSLAMKQHQKLFFAKDEKHFEQYIEGLAKGSQTTSGAILLPSTMVHEARSLGGPHNRSSVAARVKLAQQELSAKLLDGQWKSMCDRIKKSGKLESAIAVCDVSGSMGYPVFRDGTCPMDSAIGLSLLLAEIGEAPFGGGFITFSSTPRFQAVGGPSDTRSLKEKVNRMQSADWGMSTNFVSVFEDCILPIAVENRVSAEDMVKRVFVFSDMHFNAAGGTGLAEASSFERIKKVYAEAGYEMPELVFWNLAGGAPEKGAVAPKPVCATETGTALVSGYSQAQLKVFLEGGSFDEAEEEEDPVVVSENGEETKFTAKREPMTPLRLMYKAIGHEAYRMLQVVD